jgi:hypothetical protein
MRSRCCLCVCVSPIVARQLKLRGFGPLANYADRATAARQRLGKNSPVVARQRLGRNVSAVTNTHATIEELLDASFSMWRVSYQGK